MGSNKRTRGKGDVLALRLPIELDKDMRSEAQRLQVRPCDLACVTMAIGWSILKTSSAQVISAELGQRLQGGNA